MGTESKCEVIREKECKFVDEEVCDHVPSKECRVIEEKECKEVPKQECKASIWDKIICLGFNHAFFIPAGLITLKSKVMYKFSI